MHPERNRLKFYIYYKNLKLLNLVIKNNRTIQKEVLQQSSLVYQFECPLPHCKVEQYIGYTRTTLSRRLTMHLQSGGIKQHFLLAQHENLTREILTRNTTVVVKENDPIRLKIKEALYIQSRHPRINKQFDKFPTVLRLFGLVDDLGSRGESTRNNVHETELDSEVDMKGVGDMDGPDDLSVEDWNYLEGHEPIDTGRSVLPLSTCLNNQLRFSDTIGDIDDVEENRSDEVEECLLVECLQSDISSVGDKKFCKDHELENLECTNLCVIKNGDTSGNGIDCGLIEDLHSLPVGLGVMEGGFGVEDGSDDGLNGDLHSFPTGFFYHLQSTQNITVRRQRRKR